MKKFGTPSGAGPGNANEKVGFEGVGTPPEPFAGGGFEGRLAWLDFEGPEPPELPLDFEEEPLFFFWFCEPDDEPFLVVPPLPLEPDELGCVVLCVVGRDGVVVGLCEVVVVGLGEVVEVGVEEQDSETDWIAPVTGSLIEDSGVPGGTLTVNVSFWPPTSVTVITQVSAEEAVGTAARPQIASSDVVATTTTRFGLLSTVA